METHTIYLTAASMAQVVLRSLPYLLVLVGLTFVVRHLGRRGWWLAAPWILAVAIGVGFGLMTAFDQPYYLFIAGDFQQGAMDAICLMVLVLAVVGKPKQAKELA